jgi:hypothetical protein
MTEQPRHFPAPWSVVTIIAIATLASQLAYGQAAKPSGPAVGGGDRTLIPPKQPAVAPPSNTLSDLAGGGLTLTPTTCRLGRSQKKRHDIA